MANSKLLKMLSAFKKLQDERDALEMQEKLASKKVEEMMPKLVAEFETAKMQSINLNGIGTFYMDAQTFPKVEDNDTLIAWMKKNKLADLVKTTVNYQTLRGLCNERRHGNLPMPEGVTTYDKTTIKLRSADTTEGK